MLKERYLSPNIFKDLKEKMVFIGGPRQVGKTTLAHHLIGQNFSQVAYFNWDFGPDRKKILNMEFSPETELLVFDEIHKYSQWKTYLKGLYDKKGKEYRILVTGSARLDIYRRGGDSLMGRNFYYRLHPFSMAEFMGRRHSIDIKKPLSFPKSSAEEKTCFDSLFKFGGFPEPLLKQDESFIRRWQQMRMETLLRVDIRDLEVIKDFSKLTILAEILPERAAALLSLNSLTEDLSVAHKTVNHWLDILENFYYHFRVYPFTRSPLKSMKKMPKVYLWDWSQVEKSEGARLENMVACHLLKLCHFMHDAEGYPAALYYLRDLEGREIDFLVALGNKPPWMLVEVKAQEKDISKTMRYFVSRMKVLQAFQVVLPHGVDYQKDGIRVVSASRFLSALI
jgi:hypothetical protein